MKIGRRSSILLMFVEFSVCGLLWPSALKTLAPVVHRFGGDAGC